MEKNTNVYCNLCQESFNHDFFNHLLKHLPELNIICTYCEKEEVSLADLQLHLNSAHNLDDVPHNAFQFSDLFTNSSDVCTHSKKCAEWVQKSFSFDFKNILNKKEIRSIIRRSYTHIFSEYDNDCDLCDDEENHNHCGYCDLQFLRKCHLKLHVLRRHILLPDDIKRSINLCEICHKPFPTRRILIQHNNRVHGGHKDRSVPLRMKMPEACRFCDKTLANRSNLKRHMANQHNNELGSPLNQQYVFTCDYCKSLFSNKSSLKRHIENLHLKTRDTRKSISCFQCGHKFHSIKNLNSHLTSEHDVKITEEKLHFSHLNEFYTWKQEEELRTNSRFIQLRGLRKLLKKGEEISSLKFVCNRSGSFHSKSNGKRAYRVKGSSKIGRYCSAYIDIMFKENEAVNGVYCSTHSGHDNDLRYLTLTMHEKREIYEKIKSGATFSSILNEIRNNVGKEIKRKHLVTNKDLHNIVTTFKRISKPTQDDISAQSSSSSVPPQSSNDLLLEKDDRNFNNDLDLCADLWVETCQHTPQQDSRNKVNHNRNNADLSKIPYSNQHDYTLRNPPDIPQQLYKPTNCHSYENQTQERFDNSMYINNLEKSTSARQPVKDFCGINAISDDHFYPIDIVDIDSHIRNDSKISGRSVEYNNDTVNDSRDYLRSTTVYDKLPSNTNVIVIRSSDPYNSFSYSDNLPTTSNSESEALVHSTDEDDHPDTEFTSNDVTVSEDESESAENGDKQEPSDLRDRVNSVTALYNIVESELDERKKNIIRNYVDNMFRVLQYRYNKSRTKKKQNSPKQAANKQKKPKNRLQSANKKQKSNKIPDQFSVSSECTPKVPDSTYSAPSNSSTIGNLAGIRADTEFLRWNRY